jgi:hypothetical protein
MSRVLLLFAGECAVLPRLSDLNTEPGSDTVTLRLLIRVVSRQLSEQSAATNATDSEEHAGNATDDAVAMSVSDGQFAQVAALQHHMDSTDSTTKRAVKDVARAIGKQQSVGIIDTIALLAHQL